MYVPYRLDMTWLYWIRCLERDDERSADVRQMFAVVLEECSNFLKNGVFSDVTPRGSCKNRRFRGT
jgi:hypothetical protein